MLLYRFVAMALPVVLVATACTSSSDETTTSAEAATITTLAGSAPTSTTAQPDDDTQPTTSLAGITPPGYRIVQRLQGEGTGDTVVVLLDPTSYDSLSDLDIFDIIAEVVELFPPISTVHLVDDPVAANTVVNPDASQEAVEAAAEHYLARLDNGSTITYLGPFASSGTAVLGS